MAAVEALISVVIEIQLPSLCKERIQTLWPQRYAISLDAGWAIFLHNVDRNTTTERDLWTGA